MVDDMVSGDMALQAHVTVRKRARLVDQTSDVFKQAKQKMLENPTGGKLATYNQWRLDESVEDAVVRREAINNVETFKSNIAKYDEHMDY